MKRLVSIAAMSAATTMMGSGVAIAAELNMACTKAGEKRYIQVVSPGQVGQACDVRYTRDRGKNISIPYHANNSASFCDEKAAELIQTLITAGYVCTPTTATIIANIAKPVTATQTSAPEPQIASQLSLKPQVLAQAPVQATPTPVVRLQVEPTTAPPPAAPMPEPTVTAQATPKPVTSAQVAEKIIQPTAPEMPIIAEAPEDKGVLEGKMNDILADSAPIPAIEPEEAASRGPAQLTTELTEPAAPSKRASTARPSVVGRLVGAEPVAPKPVLAEAAEEPLKKVTPVTSAAVQAAPQPVKKTDARIANKAGRTVEELIVATINAQVAAWNEGNLEAFMDTYWKDDNLKFMSGVDLTKGWSSTMKNYSERYSNGAGLGRLTLDKTDVQMVTDDVAVITGRFHHSAVDASTSGAFSLVMRRFDGLWRIVHDHSVQDPIHDTRP